MKFIYKATPVGILKIVAGESGLVAILWENDDPKRVRLGEMRQGEHPTLAEASRQLDEYFAGTRTAFDLPLDPAGTGFQKRVWLALAEIPFGETRSYGQLAALLNCPGASRAVGAANGRNPLSIVLPCHRVIGANGALTGFAGGLEAKAQLLEHEKKPGNLAAPGHEAPSRCRIRGLQGAIKLP